MTFMFLAYNLILFQLGGTGFDQFIFNLSSCLFQGFVLKLVLSLQRPLLAERFDFLKVMRNF